MSGAAHFQPIIIILGRRVGEAQRDARHGVLRGVGINVVRHRVVEPLATHNLKPLMLWHNHLSAGCGIAVGGSLDFNHVALFRAVVALEIEIVGIILQLIYVGTVDRSRNLSGRNHRQPHKLVVEILVLIVGEVDIFIDCEFLETRSRGDGCGQDGVGRDQGVDRQFRRQFRIIVFQFNLAACGEKTD